MRPFPSVLAIVSLCAACAAPRPQPADPPVPARTHPAAHEHPSSVLHEHHAAAGAAELARQLDELRAATARYREHDNARSDGYRLFGKEGALMGEHWYRADLVRAPLDLRRPSTLQYAVIDGQRVLVGVAYTVYQRPGDPIPEGFAGAGDHWHVHDVEKIARTATDGRPVLRWIVNRRASRGQLGAGEGRTHLVMVHAWPWLDNPDGMFAQQHRSLPYLRVGLPALFAAQSDVAAAQGVSLLTGWGCERELDRIDFLARPERAQRRVLQQACAHAAEQLAESPAWRGVAGRRYSDADGVAAARDAAPLNAAAAAAWKSFEAARDRTLTAEQKRRLTVGIEHPAVMH